MPFSIASLCIPYTLWYKNVIGGRRWNIATQERKVWVVEIEIVRVINGIMKLTVSPGRQEYIQVAEVSVQIMYMKLHRDANCCLPA